MKLPIFMSKTAEYQQFQPNIYPFFSSIPLYENFYVVFSFWCSFINDDM